VSAESNRGIYFDACPHVKRVPFVTSSPCPLSVLSSYLDPARVGFIGQPRAESAKPLTAPHPDPTCRLARIERKKGTRSLSRLRSWRSVRSRPVPALRVAVFEAVSQVATNEPGKCLGSGCGRRPVTA